MDEVTCPRCGYRVTKRGFQTFATPPHKRQRYQCDDCGHVFTIANIIQGPEAEIKDETK